MKIAYDYDETGPYKPRISYRHRNFEYARNPYDETDEKKFVVVDPENGQILAFYNKRGEQTETTEWFRSSRIVLKQLKRSMLEFLDD